MTDILTHKEDASPDAGDFAAFERSSGNRVLKLRSTIGARPVAATGGATQTISDWAADIEELQSGAQTIAGNKTFSGDLTLTGSLQNTNTTVVAADTTPPVLTFTDGLNLISNTNDADDIVHLPVNVAADINKEIEVYAVEGFELRSADASATLNGVVIGATNECAFAAGTYAKLKCVADNTWLAVISTLADGTQTKLVPDAV